MEELFLLINNQITENVKEIKWVDWNLQQLNFEKAPTSWPLALVDVTDMQMHLRGNQQAIAESTVQITLAFKRIESSHSKTNIEFKPNAFKHFTIINKLIANLHGLEGESISPLAFQSYERSTERKHYEYVLTFKCNVYTYTNSIFTIPEVPLTAEPNINVEYE